MGKGQRLMYEFLGDFPYDGHIFSVTAKEYEDDIKLLWREPIRCMHLVKEEVAQ